jgi:hypothetical protein
MTQVSCIFAYVREKGPLPVLLTEAAVRKSGWEQEKQPPEPDSENSVFWHS